MIVEIFVHAKQYDYEDTPTLAAASYDMSKYNGDYIMLLQTEVDIPNIQMPARQQFAAHKIANLRKEQTDLQADTQDKLDKIDDRINQLLCLPATVEIHS